MTPDRKEMDRALKAILVPAIREMGFAGTLPHFRRRAPGEYQLVMLFFDRYGGAFYIEGGRLTDAEFQRKKEAWRERGVELQEGKLTVGHCSRRRRFGRPGTDNDRWFKFGPRNYQAGPSGHEPKTNVFYEAIAQEALEAFVADAPAFFGATGPR
jgi:hypothetical protein